MTRVRCPHCHQTFDISVSSSEASFQPRVATWSVYRNPDGLLCECDSCHGLHKEVYAYYDPYPSSMQARSEEPCLTYQLPERKFICKSCAERYIYPEWIEEINRVGYKEV